jgi:hypothetical protein
MKTLLFLAQIMFLVVALSSCNKDDKEINKKTPGYFVLAELNNNAGASLKSSKNIQATGFDFKDLKASKEFFFLLVNGGDEPVFNIRLSADNSQFNISPSQLNQLSGGTLINNAENTGIIPILTLGITHGTNLNGVGYVDLLPMGTNTSVLTISGQTIDNGDTIEINSSFNISVNAQVMDIELYEGLSKISITNPKGSVSTNLGGLGFMRYYSVYADSTISIKNIGNVDIDLSFGSTGIDDSHITISRSDSVSLNLPDFINFITLDSKGTITNNSRIQLGIDGKGYFSIIKDNHE